MKSGSVALNNFLLSVQGLSPTNTPIAPVASFWYADLFTVTPIGGIPYYWTSWGLPITTPILQPTNIAITAAVWSGGTATYTVQSTAALTTGQHVYVGNSSPSGFNFDNLAITVVNSTSFSVTLANPGATYAGGGSVSTLLGPYTYTAFGPYLRRSSVSWSTGLDNKEMKILLGATTAMQVNVGVSSNVLPVLQAIAQDQFAGALVRIDRLIMPAAGNISLGTYNLWLGTVGDVSVKRASAELTVNSQLIILNQQVPRAVYSPACRHVFGDSNCTFNLASVTTAGTVASGTNRFVIASNLTPPAAPAAPTAAPSLSTYHNSLINLPARGPVYVVVTYTGPTGETLASPEASISLGPSNLVVVAKPPTVANATGYNVYMGGAPGNECLQNNTPIPFSTTTYTEASVGYTTGPGVPIAGYGGYYAEGVITFASGVLQGLARQVQSSDASGNITPSSGFPQAPATGDTFTIRRGCDKSMTRCQIYGNLINFGGMPFIPQPEAGI